MISLKKGKKKNNFKDMNTFECKIFTFQDNSFHLRKNATSFESFPLKYIHTLRQRVMMIKLFKKL